MPGETSVRGRIWVIADSNGQPIHDIDTDQIYHNAHLAVTDLEEMGKYAFGNLEGWKDFSQKAKSGDILIVGSNFGAGSSRQQAVDCFRALGVIAIIGESFGAIYKRNAINSGFPLVSCPGIAAAGYKSGENMEVDFKTGEIKGRIPLHAQPFSQVELEIYLSGHLFAYGKKMEAGS